MSLHGIHRTFGVCYQTVMKWLGEKMEALPAFTDTLRPSQDGDLLEWDELWSFAGSKANTLWLWVALCRRTRQIVVCTLGDRRLQSADDLRVSLPEGATGIASPAATSGKPTRQPLLPAPIAAAAKKKGKPTMWNAGLAPCVPA